jgi:hypothetical protein
MRLINRNQQANNLSNLYQGKIQFPLSRRTMKFWNYLSKINLMVPKTRIIIIHLMRMKSENKKRRKASLTFSRRLSQVLKRHSKAPLRTIRSADQSQS